MTNPYPDARGPWRYRVVFTRAGKAESFTFTPSIDTDEGDEEAARQLILKSSRLKGAEQVCVYRLEPANVRRILGSLRNTLPRSPSNNGVSQ